MKYGKNAVAKKRNMLVSSTSMLGKKARVSFIRLCFIGMIAVCVFIFCIGLGAFKGIIDNAPSADTVDIMPLGYASFIYDADGRQIQKLADSGANRLPVSIADIPLDLQHAVVAIEDERFYEHNGIDLRGIVRALISNITSRGISEGASTITQQLLKNNVFTNWTNETSTLERFTRKFQEWQLALEIEKRIQREDNKHYKEIILENYLNTINLGAGTYGVQAASKQYFNKDVKDLTLSECATLAGITQNPTRFNPIIYPKENAKRREEVLQHMLDQNYITTAQYEEALSDDVYSRIAQAQNIMQEESNTVYSYFLDETIEQVITDLVNIKGYTREHAQDLLFSGGLKVYTTQDPAIQRVLDEEYANEENFPPGTQYFMDFALTLLNTETREQINFSKEMLNLYFKNTEPEFDLMFDSPEQGQDYVNRYKEAMLAENPGYEIQFERLSFAPQPQSSMSIIDQHTGHVLAIIGGRGQKTASLTLNRATDTTRQPGSTFKLVSTYAPALDYLGKSLATSYMDEEYTYPNGSPVNNASRTYGGLTTIRDAIRRSVNVVAVKCLEEVTPEKGLEYLDAFGFTTLAHGTEADTDANGNVWNDANLATALGGITYGVTNVELCAAYASIANGGRYIKPIYYTKILDRNGNVLIEHPSVTRQVISESTAFLLTDAMKDVVTAGTGTACQLDNMPVAGKTGTTEAYNDLWFVGYTPYYTCAVWSGFDDNEKLPDSARDFHKLLWKKVMTRLHQNLPYKDFTMPAGLTRMTVCKETGLLATDYCDAITEYIDPAHTPNEYCSGYHQYYSYEEEMYEEELQYDEFGNPIDPNAAENEQQNQENTENQENQNNGESSGDNTVEEEYQGGEDYNYDDGGGEEYTEWEYY